MQQTNNYGPFDPKYFVESDPLADMVSADKRDLGERIGKLETWLDDRKKILYGNLARIEEDVCHAESELYHVRATHPYEARPAEGIERTLFDLEQQKRFERGGAWKDMWLVNKELLELVRQYQQLKRRDQIMN